MHDWKRHRTIILRWISVEWIYTSIDKLRGRDWPRVFRIRRCARYLRCGVSLLAKEQEKVDFLAGILAEREKVGRQKRVCSPSQRYLKVVTF